MSDPQKPPAPGSDRRSHHDRRSGVDRRQQETASPVDYERRRSVEPRQPDVTELNLTPEELEALGFTRAPGDAPP